ncbi:MAG: methylenetetrahydrofolate reductase [bacterium]|nr:methylenetetrahydrofolate reductase [bacterium]
MKKTNKLAKKIESGDFIITAEYLPKVAAGKAEVEAAAGDLKAGPLAVNVADNPYGAVLSSMAASVALGKSGIEPVYQLVTRDRNRIALQSDLLGAASMGIGNVLCLSGYHQTLTASPESANVYDLDSTQLIAAIKKMCHEGELLDGTKIEGEFNMLPGAVANPYMTPLELNIIRLASKVEAGAAFVQTQAVFDVEAFKQWLDAARGEGITGKTAILAGVMPLESAAEAEELCEKHTDFSIPASIIERMKGAGDAAAQKKEGINICVEIIKELKDMDGLRGIHIISGGKENTVSELLSASGLA